MWFWMWLQIYGPFKETILVFTKWTKEFGEGDILHDFQKITRKLILFENNMLRKKYLSRKALWQSHLHKSSSYLLSVRSLLTIANVSFYHFTSIYSCFASGQKLCYETFYNMRNKGITAWWWTQRSDCTVCSLSSMFFLSKVRHSYFQVIIFIFLLNNCLSKQVTKVQYHSNENSQNIWDKNDNICGGCSMRVAKFVRFPGKHWCVQNN